MPKPRLAACGIDCTECGSYKATMFNDINAAGELIPWYRDMGWIGPDQGAEAVLAKNPLCRGCWESGDECFFRCGGGKCKFRVCCDKHNARHCGECDEFPCKMYLDFANTNAFYKKAMERLILLQQRSKT